jgi:hypothetical protein
MSTTNTAELAQAKRNAKLYYEQLMAQKAARLSQTTTAAVLVVPAVQASPTKAMAASSSKKKPKQRPSSSRESPHRSGGRCCSTARTTASKPKASKNRTVAAANSADAVAAMSSPRTKAKAWFDRTYNNDDAHQPAGPPPATAQAQTAISSSSGAAANTKARPVPCPPATVAPTAISSSSGAANMKARPMMSCPAMSDQNRTNTTTTTTTTLNDKSATTEAAAVAIKAHNAGHRGILASTVAAKVCFGTATNDEVRPGTSMEGKAWAFAEQMSAITAKIGSRPAADALFQDALRMLSMQQEFRATGKPTVVDLGYHYTKSACLTSIYTNGLLNEGDRAKLSLNVQTNGATFGHGIYTATNPCSHHPYGDAGLVVLRLAGDNKKYDELDKDWSKLYDSTTVRANTPYEMMVLKTSQQCFPVLQFDAKSVSPSNHACPGNMLLMSFHVAIQALVDKIFNS